jgi:polar amino acid transport system substrate-binding protein
VQRAVEPLECAIRQQQAQRCKHGPGGQQQQLADAVNAAIKKAWAECVNVKAMAKYGLGDKAWFIPPEKNPRISVDRPADYKAPTADHCF